MKLSWNMVFVSCGLLLASCASDPFDSPYQEINANKGAAVHRLHTRASVDSLHILSFKNYLISRDYFNTEVEQYSQIGYVHDTLVLEHPLLLRDWDNYNQLAYLEALRYGLEDYYHCFVRIILYNPENWDETKRLEEDLAFPTAWMRKPTGPLGLEQIRTKLRDQVQMYAMIFAQATERKSDRVYFNTLPSHFFFANNGFTVITTKELTDCTKAIYFYPREMKAANLLLNASFSDLSWIEDPSIFVSFAKMLTKIRYNLDHLDLQQFVEDQAL